MLSYRARLSTQLFPLEYQGGNKVNRQIKLEGKFENGEEASGSLLLTSAIMDVTAMNEPSIQHMLPQFLAERVHHYFI